MNINKNDENTIKDNVIETNDHDDELLDQDIDDNKNKYQNKSTNAISILLSSGLILQSQLNAAKIQANKTHKSVLQCLIDMEFISEKQLNKIFNSQPEEDNNNNNNVPLINYDINYDLIKKIPMSFLVNEKIFPIKTDKDGTIIVASINKYNIMLMDKISTLYGGKRVKLVQYSNTEILQAINNLYYNNHNNKYDISDLLSQLNVNDTSRLNEDSNIVTFVNEIIQSAIQERASDIHIEPEEFFIRIRFRIDGILRQKTIVHKNYWSGICVRIKVLSGMNIAESRRPQDSAMSLEINERKIDFRVSSIPTVYGENFVLRILDKQQNLDRLTSLGYNKHNIDLIELSIQKPEGIIIATGPTGSGKTTTLYSILSKINSAEKNIMTLEDPVEYRMQMVRQSEMNERIGFTFASGLRSLLRQDPDVIFLGEIRDEETAQNAVRASITGHQVFSTLHTNNAVSAINRLLDMGIPPYMLAGNLNAVISQRLVRHLCPVCKKEVPLNNNIKQAFNLDKDKSYSHYLPTGCSKCGNTGYRGRAAVSEVLFVNDNINMLIAENPTLKQTTNLALEEGFIPITEDCIEKVVNGFTSWEEVCRVVDMTSYIQKFNGEKL